MALVPMVTAAVALAGRTAAVAADAAALAGARTADVGQLGTAAGPAVATLRAAGCRQAAVVARADRATLTSCDVLPCGAASGSLQVAATVRVRWLGLPLPGGGEVSERARAGDATCLPKTPP